jgi:hypothetical protein
MCYSRPAVPFVTSSCNPQFCVQEQPLNLKLSFCASFSPLRASARSWIPASLMTSYVYHPLDSERREIRLVRLALLGQVRLDTAKDDLHLRQHSHQLAKQVPALPSWVPEWSDLDTKVGLQVNDYLFLAAGKDELLIGLVNNATLNLKGFVLDYVRRTASAQQKLSSRGLFSMFDPAKYKSYRRMCSSGSMWKRHARYVAGGSMNQAFVRTMVNNSIESHHDRGRRYLPKYMKLYGKWARQVGHGKRSPGWLDSSDHAGDGRDCQIFVGKKGYIGVAPLATKIADVICVPAGGALPIDTPSFTLTAETKYIPTRRLMLRPWHHG